MEYLGDDINEKLEHNASKLKTDKIKFKKQYVSEKKELSIDSLMWSFHNGNNGRCYVLTGLDDEGRSAVEQLYANSFDTVEEAKIMANLLGYEAHESDVWSYIIE